MSVTLICIGSEILDGRTVNTNAAFVGSMLAAHGLSITSILTIDDDPPIIARAVREALSNRDAVITIGGLGPTTDDLTKEAIAEELGLTLEFDEGVSEAINERFKRLGRVLPDNARIKQSTIISNFEVIPNEWGIAPGLWYEDAGASLCLLPGPPREFEPMFETAVLPRLLRDLSSDCLRHTIRVLGIGESTVQDKVQGILGDAPFELGYRVMEGGVDVSLKATHAQAQNLSGAIIRLKEAFGRHVATTDETLISRICDAMRQRAGLWGTAESCTGGMIASSVVDFAGVSDVFAGGVVTYSNELKMKLLNVSRTALDTFGAVSEPVARQMVVGLLSSLTLDAGIAVTGIAGPDGGTPEKPAGTVFIATAVGDDLRCTRHCFPYGRRGMRERTAITGLRQLWEQLEGIGG